MDSELLSKILRRSSSLLSEDVEANRQLLEEGVRGARVLILGAAGSIGGAFARQVIDYRPGSLHLVDVSENNLVEVVRDLRSSPVEIPQDFQTLPVAMGSPEFHAFLRTQEPYDYVLNFVALKHVRSEKDPYSLMHMVHTNTICLRDLLAHVAPLAPKKVFSVSSDKAVNPENAMGATKAVMEQLLLAYSDQIPVSSARFANVAFSDGSLLYSFGRRLEKRQPLSAPVDVRRYFISHEEAGQLCLLSGFLGGNRDIFVPKLDPTVHLLTFSEIAELYLESRGLRALRCASEDEAKRRAQQMSPSGNEWPCYFFSSDTTGEKMEEELFGETESVDRERFHAVGVVAAPAPSGSATLDAIDALERLRATQTWTKEAIIEVLRRVVPSLQHEETGKNLDQKM